MTTVVVDASVLVDALLPGPNHEAVRAALEDADDLASPEHLPIEVLSVLRRLALRGESAALITARRTLAALQLTLVPLQPIHDRVWGLRNTLSTYDAAYLAAAEHLGGMLLTSGTALLDHPDRRCPACNPRKDPQR